MPFWVIYGDGTFPGGVARYSPSLKREPGVVLCDEGEASVSDAAEASKVD